MRRAAVLVLAILLPGSSASPAPSGLDKIKHIVIIMQENRSFDSYFGTYPGADGIPFESGVPAPCLPSGAGRCVRPYHDPRDLNAGGPHGARAAVADIDGGRMDGFLLQATGARLRCRNVDNSACASATTRTDVMGYHGRRELPNYWAYAGQFVLQDRLFESNASWSLPQHLFLVSGWSARCSRNGDPMSCASALQGPDLPPDFGSPSRRARALPNYAWTDLTYLLYRRHISWAYYVMNGSAPDCDDPAAMSCAAPSVVPHTPGIWNVLPWFTTVKQDGQLGNIRTMRQFFAAARAGTLPAVAWLAPSNRYSEHPPGLVSTGQAYVTGVIDAVMRSPDWKSTAIFVSWDDWGGFYDHVVPPRVDAMGYGLRVPGLVIGPYAKRGFIDHQTLSHDAYAKFIEDVFLHGQRLDPASDGRADSRPGVRERAAVLGDLRADFDFTQAPRAPMTLPGGIEPPYKPGNTGPP